MRTSGGKNIFIVVGRLGKRLTKSKVDPFIHTEKIKHVFVFREKEGISLIKCTYITHPKWLRNLKPGFLRKLFRIVFEPVQLIFYAYKYKPDLINGVFTLPKGLYSLIAAKISGSKSMVSIIGGLPEITTYSQFKKFWQVINLWIYRNADIVTTKGLMIKTYLINHNINKNKIIVLNGAIDTDAFKRNPIPERYIDILFVGNFSHLKGPDRVVSIIENLINNFEMKYLKSVFLGNGEKFNSIKNYIVLNKLENNIELHGYSENVAEYYNKAKILIMPSISEGLSTAMLEAMAGGCVPVVSNVGNMTDAAQHGINAYVVNRFSDVEQFSAYVHELLTRHDLRIKFSENGLKLVETRYSIGAQTKLVEQLLKKLS